MRFQRLDDWLDWQATLHPEEIELGLERVARVWRKLRPEGLRCGIVTVAGTNGKGSCVAMLEAIYLQAGRRIGTYTSPHLVRYNERVRIGGRPVTDRRLCRSFERVDQARQGTMLTYFEFGTLAALDIFAAEQLELVILEVGLGGRLDAVNIVDPEVALLTTVALDHMDWLGDTVDAIGAEKAGIMRAGRPVVLAQPEMPASVHRHARDIGARVLQYGKDFRIESGQAGFDWYGADRQYLGLPKPGLPGPFQLQNAAAVLMVCTCLTERWPLEQAAISHALRSVQLPGRMQILPGEPTTIVDVAHNPEAVEALRNMLVDLPLTGSVHAVFGSLTDKDLTAIVRILGSLVASWHLLDTVGPRGQSASRLGSALKRRGVTRKMFCCGSLAQAVDSARARAAQQDAILVFGSFQVVGAFLDYLNKSGTGELL